MQPVFLGHFYWYGVMLALAFLAGIIWTYQTFRWNNLNPDSVLDMAILVILSGLVGARAGFIFINLSYFIINPLHMILLRIGFDPFSGVIFAGLALYWYFYRNKLPVWKMMDYIMPGIVLGYVITRLGAFMNGSSYGKVCNPEYIKWAVTFPYLDGIMINYPLPRHPTQLYEAILYLGVFILLVSLNRHAKFHGETFWFSLIMFSGINFVMEFFREPSGVWIIHHFTPVQFLSLGVFIFAWALLVQFQSKSSSWPE